MTAAPIPQPPTPSAAEPPQPPVLQVTRAGEGSWQASLPARAWLAAISEPVPALTERLGRFLALANVTYPDAHLIIAWMYAQQQGRADASTGRTDGPDRPAGGDAGAGLVRIGGLDGSGPLFVATNTGPAVLDPGLGYVVLSVNVTGEVYLIGFADGDGLPTGQPPDVRRITAEDPDVVLRFDQAAGQCAVGHAWHCRPDPYGYLALYRTRAGGEDDAEHVLSRHIVPPTGDGGGYIACPAPGCGHPVALTAITT